jgi:hypothetical protein
LCPRTYLRVPDHGDPHLLPCCGYLLWRSRGLNTDSWRPPWGNRRDHRAKSKDRRPNQSTKLQRCCPVSVYRRHSMQLCHIRGEFKQIFVLSSSNSSMERIKATIVSSIKSKMYSVPCLTEIRVSQCNGGSCRVQCQFGSEQVSFGPIWLRYTHLNTIRVPSDSYYGDQEEKKQHYLCASMEINLMANYYSHREKLLPLYSYGQKINLVEFFYTHTEATNKAPRFSLAIHGKMYVTTTTSPSGHIDSCTTISTTHLD